MQPIHIKRLPLLLGVSVLLGLIHNFLFWDVEIGLNFSIFAILTLFGGWLVVRKGEKTFDKQALVLTGLIIFFSAMVFFRSSELLTFFNVIGSGLLLFILVDSYTGKKLRGYLPEDYFKVIFLPFRFIVPFFQTLGEILALRKIGEKSPRTREIIRGILIALPAVIIFTLLFASADAIFGKIVENLFSFEINDEVVGRIILWGFITAFCIGGLGYMFRKSFSANPSAEKRRSLGAIEIMIPLVSVNVLFFIFVVFQMTYLFGGESQVFAQGLTYAEYARKGFFELIVVAALTYLIISFAERQVIKSGDQHLSSFKTLSTLLLVQAILVLISAFFRLSLYEAAYGFTTIRLYSHALMIWMSVVFILLAYHIITSGNRVKFGLRVFASVVLLLFSMNMINPDAFIAKRNIERYGKTGVIDTYYLANLSSDALPYTIRLLEDPNEEVKRNFALKLYGSYTYKNAENFSWKSSRFMQLRSKEIIAPYKAEVERIKSTDLTPSFDANEIQGGGMLLI